MNFKFGFDKWDRLNSKQVMNLFQFFYHWSRENLFVNIYTYSLGHYYPHYPYFVKYIQSSINP